MAEAVEVTAHSRGLSTRTVWKSARMAKRHKKTAARLEQLTLRNKLFVATKILATVLKGGPKPALIVMAKVAKFGVSDRTARRAARAVVLKQRIGGTKGHWQWRLRDDWVQKFLEIEQ